MEEQDGVTTEKIAVGLIIAVLFSFAVLIAACPCARATSIWTRTYGGAAADLGTGETFQTSDGGYIISGDTNSYGAGGSDFWLIKTDSEGNMQWNKTYGGVLDEVSGDMWQTNDGGYVMSGYTTSFGAGGKDAWLVVTDATGTAYWSNAYGGTGDEYAHFVIQTADGGYAFTGYTTSFGAGGQDLWLVKTDAAGNMQWNKTYGGNSTDFGYCLIQVNDGGLVISGYTASFGTGSEDAWLFKTDPSGNMLWNKTYGGNGIDRAVGIIQTSDGGYALTGFSTSFAAGSKVYLVKTDSNGNLQWNKTYGATASEAAIHGIQTADGGYAMVGWNFANGQDFILVKTDASGNLQWETSYGGPGIENGYALLQASDGGYVLTGNTNSFGAGSTDIWLVKTDALGVVPEYSSLLVPALVLTATAFIIINKNRLSHAH